MKVEQIYTGCLAQGAYYIENNGEAAIIDPLREVQPYIEKAKRNNATIKYVFETHFHADFVSGHIDLSAKTGLRLFMDLMLPVDLIVFPLKMDKNFHLEMLKFVLFIRQVIPWNQLVFY